MASAALSNHDVIELVKKLSPSEKYSALLTLAEGAQPEREATLKRAEMRLRDLAKNKGLDWDALGDDERLALVDDIVHNTRR